MGVVPEPSETYSAFPLVGPPCSLVLTSRGQSGGAFEGDSQNRRRIVFRIVPESSTLTSPNVVYVAKALLSRVLTSRARPRSAYLSQYAACVQD